MEPSIDLTNEISLRQRFLNFLVTKVHKCLNGISADIMDDVLTFSNHGYNTWYYIFVTDKPKTNRYGKYSIHIGLIKYGTYCPVK